MLPSLLPGGDPTGLHPLHAQCRVQPGSDPCSSVGSCAGHWRGGTPVDLKYSDECCRPLPNLVDPTCSLLIFYDGHPNETGRGMM